MQEISCRQVQRLIFGTRACLIEVLSEQSFQQAHLPGAINVPLDDDFDAHVQDAVPDKNVPIIVYCSDSDCRLSPAAGRRLEVLGYTKVFDYSAGKSDWQRSGLQTEKGPAEKPF
jgi:rhodanese-related sulfurtransferase